MTRRPALLLLLAAVACSSLPDAGDGVVALQIQPPDSLVVTVGHSITLQARALDIHGDPIAATIFWRTPDTAFVTLDSVLGVLGGRAVGTARIQARVGSLASDVLTFTVRAEPTAPGDLRQP